MTRIFISYSRKDQDFARRLALAFEDIGDDVWIDLEDIIAGNRWSSAIQDGLDSCEVLLLILSPDSMDSTNVQDEWQYALDHSKAVIPILWRETKVHFQLNRLHYIDFKNQDFAAAFKLLRVAIHQKLTGGRAAAPRLSTLQGQQPVRSKRRFIGVGLAVIVTMLGAFIATQGRLPFLSPETTRIFITPTQSASITPFPVPTVTHTLVPVPTNSVSGAQQIVFVSRRDTDNELYAINVDGSGLKRLTNHLGVDFYPAWSPDGSQLAYVYQQGENYDIYVMDADGSNVVRLTEHDAHDYAPAWSPDGSRLAFTTSRNGAWEIYVMDNDGTNLVRLTRSTTEDWNPSWSPDGARIAYFTNQDDTDEDEEVNWEIYVMNADGSNPTRLTDHPAADNNPSWSSDGSKIAFHSNRDGNWEIYVMNADGSNPTRLTDNAAEDYAPVWSPDSSQIAFYSDRDEKRAIYVMDADGTNPFRVTDLEDDARSPSWRR